MTGKTKIAADVIVNMGIKRVLVLCPKKVIPTWRDEIAIHAGAPVKVVLLRDEAPAKGGKLRQVSVVEKVNKARLALALCEAADIPCVIVVNYESAWREPFGPSYEMKEYFDSKAGKKRAKQVMTDKGFALTASFDLVIMDEGHKIKAPGGKASRFAAHFPQHIPWRLELTGTAMAHGPLDVYAQFRALDPGVFGASFQKFRDEYAIMGGFENRQILGYRNQEDFAARMSMLTYTVGSEVLDLPPARHQTLYCQLSSSARTLYRKLEKEMVASIPATNDETAATVEAQNVLVKLLRCQQIACGFVKDEAGQIHQVDTAKRDLLADTMQEFPKDQPLVVFCKFQHDLDAVHVVCREQGRTSGEISGRKDDLEEFKAGAFDVVAVQIQAGGAGVNLTRSHVAIYFSVGYSRLDFEQSLKRLDRPGQSESVLNIHLLAEGTVDEDVYASLAAKNGTVSDFMRRVKARQKLEEEAAAA